MLGSSEPFMCWMWCALGVLWCQWSKKSTTNRTKMQANKEKYVFYHQGLAWKKLQAIHELLWCILRTITAYTFSWHFPSVTVEDWSFPQGCSSAAGVSPCCPTVVSSLCLGAPSALPCLPPPLSWHSLTLGPGCCCQDLPKEPLSQPEPAKETCWHCHPSAFYGIFLSSFFFFFLFFLPPSEVG